MATSLSLTTSYAGESSAKWVSAALLSGNTLANGGMTILPNIPYKTILHKLGTDGLLKNATCDFDPTSTVTITERSLTLEQFQVNVNLCKSNFITSWQSAEMGFSANKVLPKSFQDYFLAYMADKVSADVETSIWRGANATAGQVDGIVTLIAADAALPTAQEVAGTTVTASNVIAELGKILDAIPAALYGREDLRIYIPQNIARAYVRALGGFGASGLGANGTDNKGTQWYSMMNDLYFDGVKLFVANGLAANTAIATTIDNLYFGAGLMSDLNEIKVIDTSEILGDQNVRFVMRAGMAVNYVNAEEIVTYGITNSAN
jgi:hypothetical protein